MLALALLRAVPTRPSLRSWARRRPEAAGGAAAPGRSLGPGRGVGRVRGVCGGGARGAAPRGWGRGCRCGRSVLVLWVGVPLPRVGGGGAVGLAVPGLPAVGRGGV